jgi:hypothetical protein
MLSLSYSASTQSCRCLQVFDAYLQLVVCPERQLIKCHDVQHTSQRLQKHSHVYLYTSSQHLCMCLHISSGRAQEATAVDPCVSPARWLRTQRSTR